MSPFLSMSNAEKHTSAKQDAQPDLRNLMAQYALPDVHRVAKDLESMSTLEATSAGRTALEQFNIALKANSTKGLENLGAYDYGVEAADNLFMMLPTIVDAQLGRGLFTQLASQEPDRYTPLKNLGFPVFDSMDPDAALMHNLVERGGGHYVDTGATSLLTDQKVSFVANVEPKVYTPTGLLLSDDSTLDTDAVIWCTGFADKDVRQTVKEILKISLPVDATWGVNEQGEIRGMWRRHSQVKNFWVMGGYTQQHRWFSQLLALQIKAELEGILPEAYGMDMPAYA
ncbi:uncharacterized protein M437DRAFT_69646 [Aureobasidium melanogenum CBS 110374]|uniref:FAD/NAD(P)-binding domain-containing protein n=1 Tax=Aureobasidium melanogenum (strain CBS 110374) TaxID=1043003 RepID=A0A074VDF6_AURM1|nr:uncharacterized protein M437DRAFT_69646 [Aureobasidium melanogenum CBS 110374]KEQ58710.1 hypothetical protein M437DRAFT_69646 [Aureobasidium melanogenum CBS 110374]